MVIPKIKNMKDFKEEHSLKSFKVLNQTLKSYGKIGQLCNSRNNK